MKPKQTTRLLAFVLICILLESQASAQLVATAKYNGKWGFIDTTGKWVIPPRFDSLENFYHGYAKIFHDGKEGLIDTKGEVVLKPEYDYVGHVSDGVTEVYKDTQMFFHVNRRSFRPAPSSNSDNMNVPKTSPSSGPKPSKTSENGFPVPPPSELVYAGKDGTRRTFRVLSYGDMHTYERLYSLNYFITPSFGQLGKRYPGNDTIILMWDYRDGMLKDSLLWFSAEGKYGLTDIHGNVLHPAELSDIDYFYDGLAAVMNGKYWGFISTSGKMVIPARYERVMNVKNGYVAVLEKTRWGFLNPSGRVVIKAVFENTDGNFREPWHGFDPIPFMFR